MHIVLKLTIYHDGRSLFFGDCDLGCLLGLSLLELFLSFFVFASMEKGKRSIKAITLASTDKIIHIQFICIFTTCASVEIQFLNLDLTINWKGIGEAFSTSIDGSNFLEEIFELVN